MKRILSLFLVLGLTVSLGSAAGTVTSKAATVKINKNKVTLTVGKSISLKVKGTTKKAKWSSSKKSVATVGAKTGKVTAKKAGTATITAKISGKKYRCKVTVKPKETEKAGSKNNPLSAYDKYTFDYYEEGKKRGKISLQLLSYISGDEAAELAKNNSSNPVPQENQEYIYFKFQIQYHSGTQTVNARNVFNYYYNIYGENSTTQIENLDWGFFFESVDDLGSTILQPGNKIICSKAILIYKGYDPITYKVQTGKNTYTWFTTEME